MNVIKSVTNYFLVLMMVFCSMQLQATELRIAAAANLRYVLPELAELFTQKTGDHIAITYAASGTLTTQIQHGAPFDIFLSADSSYIQRLADAGFIMGEPTDFASAQMVLFAAEHSSLLLDKGLEGLKQALEQGSVNKIAIANPRHAPYGQEAKTALQQAGVWQAAQAHLLIAENASQAVQFSLSSSVDAGFIPYGHAIQAQIAARGHFIKLEQIVSQHAAVIKNATEHSEQFLVFLHSSDAVTILNRYGFLVSRQQ